MTQLKKKSKIKLINIIEPLVICLIAVIMVIAACFFVYVEHINIDMPCSAENYPELQTSSDRAMISESDNHKHCCVLDFNNISASKCVPMRRSDHD